MTTRPMIAGALAALALLATACGGLSVAIPTSSLAGPPARMLDGYAPWLLALGLACALFTALAGARRTAMVLTLLVATASVFHLTAYRAVTRPPDPTLAPDLRVLFLNTLAGNTGNAEAILAAAAGTEADILVFAEAGSLLDSLDTLRDSYTFVSPCAGETCELLIATNLPVLRNWQLQLNPAWPERYAVVEVDVPGHGPLFLAAGHVAKPWLSGLAEPELARLTAQLNWLTGPSLVVGDFNAPPWSRPLRTLLRDTGFRAPRGGPGTWPASAVAAFRLPIDHVLTRDDVAVTSLAPFGAGLGSNHLGLVADIALP
jgi:endonuclease/exonuclease/phosphatase (EEP) superfamily protein YafD